MFWNTKMSLTAVREPQDILRFHFGESLFALQFSDIRRGRLADVGSGAGFPGLAIKILRPELELILIEPNMKKCAFLAELTRVLDLTAVEIIPEPFEQSGISPLSLQFVTSRALAKFTGLLSWSAVSLAAGGSIVLWVSKEQAAQIGEDHHFGWASVKVIPGTRHRSILIGQKPI
jgi:16S rRNA (guanine527-N7)-methyltransferase